MERERVFVPEWKGSVEGFAVKYMSSQVWKLQPECDLDDLMQDSYLYFLICCDRYPQVVEGAHFMALFKTCLWTHIMDLSGKKMRRHEVLASSLVESGQSDEIQTLVVAHSGIDDVETSMLIDDILEVADPAVAKFVQMSMSGKPEKYQKRRNVRETTPEYVTRMTGKPGSEVMARLKSWVTGNKMVPV